MWQVVAGAELRVNYEAGKSIYWKQSGRTPVETAWRGVRVRPPPPSGAEPEVTDESLLPKGAANCFPGYTTRASPQLSALSRRVSPPAPWHGASGGDERLRVLVPLLLQANPCGGATRIKPPSIDTRVCARS